MLNDLLSTLPDVIWPALPSARAAGLLAVLFQLEKSQWLSADELCTHQLSQLGRVVDYARRTVPYYKERLADVGKIENMAEWQQLPLLTRRDIQHAGNAIHSSALPDGHGATRSSSTGGSTGQPVVTLGTGLTDFFWHALTIRDHLWHKRDLRQSFAAIRYTGKDDAQPPAGATDANWGAATRGVCETGPAYLLNIRSTIEEQATWLAGINPGYVLSYPSALRAMAERCTPEVRQLTNLKELRTFCEIQQHWNPKAEVGEAPTELVALYFAIARLQGCLQCSIEPSGLLGDRERGTTGVGHVIYIAERARCSMMMICRRTKPAGRSMATTRRRPSQRHRPTWQSLPFDRNASRCPGFESPSRTQQSSTHEAVSYRHPVYVRLGPNSIMIGSWNP